MGLEHWSYATSSINLNTTQGFVQLSPFGKNCNNTYHSELQNIPNLRPRNPSIRSKEVIKKYFKVIKVIPH